MTQEKLFQEITSGKIFTAQFIKKDGSRRLMNCRTNVKKFTNGLRSKEKRLSFHKFINFDKCKD